MDPRHHVRGGTVRPHPRAVSRDGACSGQRCQSWSGADRALGRDAGGDIQGSEGERWEDAANTSDFGAAGCGGGVSVLYEGCGG